MAEAATTRSDSQQRMIDYLNLQNKPERDQIIDDLLTQGRRSFCTTHKTTSLATILSKVNHADFLELMKRDICETWETRLIAAEREIQEFFNEIKQDNEDQLDALLTKVAENGNIHSKPSSQILFLVFGLTFPDIENDKHVADNLWICLTTDGLKCLNDFSNYISRETLTEQSKEHPPSPLYLALSQYYKDELKELLEQYLKITATKNIYDFATSDALARYGWSEGIKHLSSRIAPRRYNKILQAVSNKVEEQKSKIIVISPGI